MKEIVRYAISWKFWAIVMIFIIVIICITCRSDTNYEMVGITPLQEALGDGSGGLSYGGSDFEYWKTLPEEKTTFQPLEIKNIEIPPIAQYGSIGEEATCKALESILRKPVAVGGRKYDIINPKTGRQLEIDCYVDGIGVEYSGEQHYVYPNKFHKKEKDFLDQVERDKFKVEECDRKGIYLIVIPYTVDTCVMTKNGPVKKKHCKQERYIRIYSYLHHVLKAASLGEDIGEHYTTHYMG